MKRTYARPETLAWKTALRWMFHLRRERDRLRTLVSRTQMATVMCKVDGAQCSAILQGLHEVAAFLTNINRSTKVLGHLPMQLQSF